jgi:dTDP-4-amino-4,6-dideoxygalactose transaminase
MTDMCISKTEPVRENFLVFGAPDIQEPEIQEVLETLRSGWLGMGPRSHKFEEMFKAYIGCRHAISLNSCTAGLELALEALGVGPGDEVITTPLTFCATANVIVHRGAKPVFADINPETGSIDLDEVLKAITPRTKAIMPVHLWGQPCQMDKLMPAARENGLYVVEDAAHAAEAWQNGKKIGTVGDITVFSFYVTKNLTTGEGGMLVTDNEAWAEEVRTKRLHGLSHDAWKRYTTEGFQPYDVLAAGYKYNMMDMQAALGIHQLGRLESNLKIRERYWQMYDEAFSGIDEVTPFRVTEDETAAGRTTHSRHLYTLLLNPERSGMSRWEFINAMKAENIGTGIHYVALHLTTFYKEKFGYRRGDFPQAEYVSDRIVSLPLSTSMSEEDVTDVIRAVKKVLSR